MNAARFLWVWMVLAGPLAATAAVVEEDPLDRKVLDIAAELRCTVCQNQPVSESNSDLARDMRTVIREHLVAGRSREEIIQYFVERYGDYVLLKPADRGAGRLLWVAPIALLAGLGAFGLMWLRKRRKATAPAPQPVSEADLARLRDLGRGV